MTLKPFPTTSVQLGGKGTSTGKPTPMTRRKFVGMLLFGAATVVVGGALTGCGIKSQDGTRINTVYSDDMKVELVSRRIDDNTLGTEIAIAKSGNGGEYTKVLILNSVEIMNNGEKGVIVGNGSGVDNIIPGLDGKYRITVEAIWKGDDVRAVVHKIE